MEEILATGDAIIEIVVNESFGSRVKTFHQTSFALIKVVRNATPGSWDFFNIALEKRPGIASDYPGIASDYYDGLSFGQSTRVNRPFTSDVFAKVEDILEPRDVIRFSNGRVPPGSAARFVMSVTHTAPAPRFFLVQHVRRPAVSLPPRAVVAEAEAAMASN